MLIFFSADVKWAITVHYARRSQIREFAANIRQRVESDLGFA
jgi:hypothetical protein